MFWALGGVLFIAMFIMFAMVLSGSLINLQVCDEADIYTATRTVGVDLPECGTEDSTTYYCDQDRDACIDPENHKCCRAP